MSTHYNKRPVGAGVALACGLNLAGHDVVAMSRVPADVTCKSCLRSRSMRKWARKSGWTDADTDYKRRLRAAQGPKPPPVTYRAVKSECFTWWTVVASDGRVVRRGLDSEVEAETIAAKMNCQHDFQPVPGAEPPVDVCCKCGEVQQ